ncbi:serine/threonine-protein kinase ATM, partial [Kipferlia bialata]
DLVHYYNRHNLTAASGATCTLEWDGIINVLEGLNSAKPKVAATLDGHLPQILQPVVSCPTRLSQKKRLELVECLLQELPVDRGTQGVSGVYTVLSRYLPHPAVACHPQLEAGEIVHAIQSHIGRVDRPSMYDAACHTLARMVLHMDPGVFEEHCMPIFDFCDNPEAPPFHLMNALYVRARATGNLPLLTLLSTTNMLTEAVGVVSNAVDDEAVSQATTFLSLVALGEVGSEEEGAEISVHPPPIEMCHLLARKSARGRERVGVVHGTTCAVSLARLISKVDHTASVTSTLCEVFPDIRGGQTSSLALECLIQLLYTLTPTPRSIATGTSEAVTLALETVPLVLERHTVQACRLLSASARAMVSMVSTKTERDDAGERDTLLSPLHKALSAVLGVIVVAASEERGKGHNGMDTVPSAALYACGGSVAYVLGSLSLLGCRDSDVWEVLRGVGGMVFPLPDCSAKKEDGEEERDRDRERGSATDECAVSTPVAKVLAIVAVSHHLALSLIAPRAAADIPSYKGLDAATVKFASEAPELPGGLRYALLCSASGMRLRDTHTFKEALSPVLSVLGVLSGLVHTTLSSQPIGNVNVCKSAQTVRRSFGAGHTTCDALNTVLLGGGADMSPWTGYFPVAALSVLSTHSTVTDRVEDRQSAWGETAVMEYHLRSIAPTVTAPLSLNLHDMHRVESLCDDPLCPVPCPVEFYNAAPSNGTLPVGVTALTASQSISLLDVLDTIKESYNKTTDAAIRISLALVLSHASAVYAPLKDSAVAEMTSILVAPSMDQRMQDAKYERERVSSTRRSRRGHDEDENMFLTAADMSCPALVGLMPALCRLSHKASLSAPPPDDGYEGDQPLTWSHLALMALLEARVCSKQQRIALFPTDMALLTCPVWLRYSLPDPVENSDTPYVTVPVVLGHIVEPVQTKVLKDDQRLTGPVLQGCVTRIMTHALQDTLAACVAHAKQKATNGATPTEDPDTPARKSQSRRVRSRHNSPGTNLLDVEDEREREQRRRDAIPTVEHWTHQKCRDLTHNMLFVVFPEEEEQTMNDMLDGEESRSSDESPLVKRRIKRGRQDKNHITCCGTMRYQVARSILFLLGDIENAFLKRSRDGLGLGLLTSSLDPAVRMGGVCALLEYASKRPTDEFVQECIGKMCSVATSVLLPKVFKVDRRDGTKTEVPEELDAVTVSVVWLLRMSLPVLTGGVASIVRSAVLKATTSRDRDRVLKYDSVRAMLAASENDNEGERDTGLARLVLPAATAMVESGHSLYRVHSDSQGLPPDQDVWGMVDTDTHVGQVFRIAVSCLSRQQQPMPAIQAYRKSVLRKARDAARASRKATAAPETGVKRPSRGRPTRRASTRGSRAKRRPTQSDPYIDTLSKGLGLAFEAQSQDVDEDDSHEESEAESEGEGEGESGVAGCTAGSVCVGVLLAACAVSMLGIPDYVLQYFPAEKDAPEVDTVTLPKTIEGMDSICQQMQPSELYAFTNQLKILLHEAESSPDSPLAQLCAIGSAIHSLGLSRWLYPNGTWSVVEAVSTLVQSQYMEGATISTHTNTPLDTMSESVLTIDGVYQYDLDEQEGEERENASAKPPSRSLTAVICSLLTDVHTAIVDHESQAERERLAKAAEEADVVEIIPSSGASPEDDNTPGIPSFTAANSVACLLDALSVYRDRVGTPCQLLMQGAARILQTPTGMRVGACVGEVSAAFTGVTLDESTVDPETAMAKYEACLSTHRDSCVIFHHLSAQYGIARGEGVLRCLSARITRGDFFKDLDAETCVPLLAGLSHVLNGVSRGSVIERELVGSMTDALSLIDAHGGHHTDALSLSLPHPLSGVQRVTFNTSEYPESSDTLKRYMRYSDAADDAAVVCNELIEANRLCGDDGEADAHLALTDTLLAENSVLSRLTPATSSICSLSTLVESMCRQSGSEGVEAAKAVIRVIVPASELTGYIGVPTTPATTPPASIESDGVSDAVSVYNTWLSGVCAILRERAGLGWLASLAPFSPYAAEWLVKYGIFRLTYPLSCCVLKGTDRTEVLGQIFSVVTGDSAGDNSLVVPVLADALVYVGHMMLTAKTFIHRGLNAYMNGQPNDPSKDIGRIITNYSLNLYLPFGVPLSISTAVASAAIESGYNHVAGWITESLGYHIERIEWQRQAVSGSPTIKGALVDDVLVDALQAINRQHQLGARVVRQLVKVMHQMPAASDPSLVSADNPTAADIAALTSRALLHTSPEDCVSDSPSRTQSATGGYLARFDTDDGVEPVQERLRALTYQSELSMALGKHADALETWDQALTLSLSHGGETSSQPLSLPSLTPTISMSTDRGESVRERDTSAEAGLRQCLLYSGNSYLHQRLGRDMQASRDAVYVPDWRFTHDPQTTPPFPTTANTAFTAIVGATVSRDANRALAALHSGRSAVLEAITHTKGGSDVGMAGVSSTSWAGVFRECTAEAGSKSADLQGMGLRSAPTQELRLSTGCVLSVLEGEGESDTDTGAVSALRSIGQRAKETYGKLGMSQLGTRVLSQCGLLYHLLNGGSVGTGDKGRSGEREALSASLSLTETPRQALSLEAAKASYSGYLEISDKLRNQDYIKQAEDLGNLDNRPSAARERDFGKKRQVSEVERFLNQTEALIEKRNSFLIDSLTAYLQHFAKGDISGSDSLSVFRIIRPLLDVCGSGKTDKSASTATSPGKYGSVQKDKEVLILHKMRRVTRDMLIHGIDPPTASQVIKLLSEHLLSRDGSPPLVSSHHLLPAAVILVTRLASQIPASAPPTPAPPARDELDDMGWESITTMAPVSYRGRERERERERERKRSRERVPSRSPRESSLAAARELLRNVVLRMAVDHPFHVVPHLIAIGGCEDVLTDLLGPVGQEMTVDHSVLVAAVQGCQAAVEFYPEVFRLATPSKNDRHLSTRAKNKLKTHVKTFNMAVRGTRSRTTGRRSGHLIAVPSYTVPARHAIYKGGKVQTLMQYRDTPLIRGISENIAALGGVNGSKKVSVHDTHGMVHEECLKMGKDDMLQTNLVMSFFDCANVILQNQRGFSGTPVRTYKVHPFSQSSASSCGVLQMVPTCISYHQWLESGDPWNDGVPACSRYMLPGCIESSADFAHALKGLQMQGHQDRTSGQVVHIDLEYVFNDSDSLTIPEKCPVRLTQNVVDGLGPAGLNGLFRSTANSALATLREQRDMFLVPVSVVAESPSFRWGEKADTSTLGARAVQGVAHKLAGIVDGRHRSVDEQMQHVVQESTDLDNLGSMYSGWRAWL